MNKQIVKQIVGDYLQSGEEPPAILSDRVGHDLTWVHASSLTNCPLKSTLNRAPKEEYERYVRFPHLEPDFETRLYWKRCEHEATTIQEAFVWFGWEDGTQAEVNLEYTGGVKISGRVDILLNGVTPIEIKASDKEVTPFRWGHTMQLLSYMMALDVDEGYLISATLQKSDDPYQVAVLKPSKDGFKLYDTETGDAIRGSWNTTSKISKATVEMLAMRQLQYLSGERLIPFKDPIGDSHERMMGGAICSYKFLPSYPKYDGQEAVAKATCPMGCHFGSTDELSVKNVKGKLVTEYPIF